MKLVYRRKTRKWISFTSFLVLLLLAFHAISSSVQKQADELIITLYQKLNHPPLMNMQTRLEVISSEFIGKKYLLGALGEGSKAHYDQEPKYRTDAFDCDTYVTTVLALSLAKDKQGFKRCLAKIRYKNGQIEFTMRNHFTSLDWNPNNQQQHFIRDVTRNFKDQNNRQVAQIATALIDKPSWYQHFTKKNIRLNSADEKIQTERLAELKSKGSQLEKQNAQIPYLPLTALFDSQGNANQFLFAQIPNGAIVEIVRPNWDVEKLIGTHLNVSHLGFAFWKKGSLWFRQASSQYGKVVEVPFIDYLRKALTSPTIKGINVEVVVPKAPLNESCTNTEFR